ncbi:MAG TPA: hypothetical protein EYG11_02600 [Candidatus Latescibacteria bacterium]|nr:hypothetical protein [Candidatus Handelsmanbacteria bacterium]HIL07569.1 hypothetical protein [Candidatus Latescibacterota bacterium]
MLIRAAKRNTGPPLQDGAPKLDDWRVHPLVRLRGGYTYLKIDVDVAAGDSLGEKEVGKSPVHEAALSAAYIYL